MANDTISRQMAIDAVADGLKGVFVEYRDIAEKMIGKLPSAERKGHWETYLKEGLKYKCSVCGSRFNLAWTYCPRCGARMERE